MNKNTSHDQSNKEHQREKYHTTIDEVESLQIAEAPSYSSVQTKKLEQEQLKDEINDDHSIMKNEITSATPSIKEEEKKVPLIEPTNIALENDEPEEPIKTAQPIRDSDVTQDNAEPSKESQEHETLYQDIFSDSTNKKSFNSSTDFKEIKTQSPWEQQQQQQQQQQNLSNGDFMTLVDGVQEEHNHRVADVLADLENSVSSLQPRYEFPTVDIDAPRDHGDTSEKSPVEHPDRGVFDAKSSEEKSEPTRNTSFSDSIDGRKELEMDQQDRLGNLLPAMEDSARETMAVHDRIKVAVDNPNITPEEQHRAARSHEFEHPIEDPIDLDMFRDNVINIPAIDPKSIPVNYLTPREQEEAGMLLLLL